MKDLIWIIFSSAWFTILVLAYIFYYLSLRYWKKKDFLDKVGWGILSLPRKYKNLPEPCRTYGIISMILIGIFSIIGLTLVAIGIIKFVLLSISAL